MEKSNIGLSRRMATFQQYQQEKTNPMTFFSDKDTQIISLEAFQDIKYDHSFQILTFTSISSI